LALFDVYFDFACAFFFENGFEWANRATDGATTTKVVVYLNGNCVALRTLSLQL